MPRILLADDESILRMVMGRQLQLAGHEVSLACDGIEALELMSRETFDVVVTDVRMPRLDGIGLLAKAADVAPDTEFVILTGHGSIENAVEAFKVGNVFDYLVKPLQDKRELDAVVERAAERRRLRRDNIRLVADLRDRVSELEEARRVLADLAERDSLTGLMNHRGVHSRLNDAIKESKQSPVAVMLLDIDGFKAFNDTYGHVVGDQLLRHVADALRSSAPEDAYVGRCGGDEFLLVKPGHASNGIMTVARRATESLSVHPFRSPDGTALPVQLCFGIADTETAGKAAERLLAAADSALYEAKQRGGGSVKLHMVSVDDDNRETKSAFTVLDGLITAIDHKDRYTRRHGEHVAEHAVLLAEALGLSDETLDAVRTAGLLHDVGKIGIPDGILRKPGKLEPREVEVMRSHVVLSSLIIHGLPRLTDILDAVSNHHERWDGQGYPRGVKGTETPLLGRVMAITDAYSAMTLDRPYRAAMQVEQAIDEIDKGAGTQFDPELSRLFVKTLRARDRALLTVAQAA